MKKVLFTLFAVMTVFSAKAFVFDGIDLNGTTTQVTREVASKGYVFDLEKQCLKGNCQGTDIYLSFNTTDVKEKNKIGQLIVTVPMKGADALANTNMIFSVIYHLESSANGVNTYSVSEDGTTLAVKQDGQNIILTYSTPNYKK